MLHDVSVVEVAEDTETCIRQKIFIFSEGNREFKTGKECSSLEAY
jgi:hypothetical protein